jgi:hypothetical protein
VNAAEAHRALVVTLSGRRVLADAAFPFPVLVPLQLPSKEIPSSFGTLNVASAAEGDVAGAGLRVTCDARGEVADLLRLAPGAGARANEARAPAALRVLDDRVLYWAGGVMTILDAWSVLAYPLAGTERAAFEALFALNLEGIGLPDLPAAAFTPTLTVFHSVPLAPEEVRRGLDLGAPPPSALVASRGVFVEEAPGGSRIALTAMLAEAVPPAGPGESVRKTLVFHLAMDLLALGRGA